MGDSTPIVAKPPPDTLTAPLLDILGRLQYKHAALLFVIFIVLCIDIFDDHVISKFNGAISDGEPTGYGLIIKGTILVIAYLAIDALIKLSVV